MNKLGPLVASFVIHAGVLACATAIGIPTGSVPSVILAELTMLAVPTPVQPESRPPRPGRKKVVLPRPIVTPAPRAPSTPRGEFVVAWHEEHFRYVRTVVRVYREREVR